MRWEALFADLEAQLAAADEAAAAAEIADRSRAERARICLADRLRAREDGGVVRCGVTGAGVVAGRVRTTGADWVLLASTAAGPPEVLVPLAAVLWVEGLDRLAAPVDEGAVASRLGLGYALRALSRDRCPVHLTFVDGSSTTGTIDGVLADALDLAVHPADEPRRAGDVRGRRTVAFQALAVLRAG